MSTVAAIQGFIAGVTLPAITSTNKPALIVPWDAVILAAYLWAALPCYKRSVDVYMSFTGYWVLFALLGSSIYMGIAELLF
jgi:hypothetical protein